jgi:hypothetical protein
MKTPLKMIAIALAATIATSSLAAPAAAYYKPWFKYHKMKKAPTISDNPSSTGQYVVACIAGNALGLIAASLIKKSGELTSQQAQTIAFSPCGVGFFLVASELR